jgi:hypothetical protein
MKEQMFSGIDTDDDSPKMVWVRGDEMITTYDIGDGDPWRDESHGRCQNFNEYYSEPHDPSRFTDLTLVWERDV